MFIARGSADHLAKGGPGAGLGEFLPGAFAAGDAAPELSPPALSGSTQRTWDGRF
jgi:hypothetical protein